MVVNGDFGIYGNKIFVNWYYEERTTRDGKVMRDTFCTIKSPASSEPIAVVPAYQSPEDKFVKEKGRKISLTRALKLGRFTKQQSRVIWDTYFNRRLRVACAE